MTLGKPVLMGRKTYESIGKPLPGRHNIVLTRDANYRRDGVTVVHDADAAIRAASGAEEIMVIGGADLFRLFLGKAARVHLTRVHGDIAGNVHWTPLDGTWRRTAAEERGADERHAWPLTFEVWEKG